MTHVHLDSTAELGLAVRTHAFQAFEFVQKGLGTGALLQAGAVASGVRKWLIVVTESEEDVVERAQLDVTKMRLKQPEGLPPVLLTLGVCGDQAASEIA
ncbi:hypothetical protein [Nocardioides ochotonae]|uniref:hypothetical protein n=1 Tax=Nocardioides ochotonae TaxID=2685869 RepID=UPI00140C030C|nr:hypothetical protein [Nocardioides ochotonae]